jgi:chromosome segregation ATPase
LFGGVRGLSTGAYEKRVAAREARLARLRAIQNDLNDDKSVLASEKEDKQKTITALKEELVALELDSQGLSRDVARLEEERGAQDARVLELRGRIASLQKKLDMVNRASGDEAMQRETLRRKAAALSKEYEAVLDLYLELER